MDKTLIKNFAIWARRRLIEDVNTRANYYGIYKDKPLDEELEYSNDRKLHSREIRQRKELIKKLKKESYDDVIEEIAYTWFNRLIALYYMEINGYLEIGGSLFLDGDGSFNPTILKSDTEVNINYMQKDIALLLKNEGCLENLYRFYIVSVGNALRDSLPETFKRISGYAELLCPVTLLEEDGVISYMVSRLPRNDWENNVEIIGWLYQFYNTEPKNLAFAMLKENQKLSKERIPEATQLFTPEWIVGYLVENTLGRYWVENTNDLRLIDYMPYFIKGNDFHPRYNEAFRVEDMTFIDPCMGSGHILNYAFELFLKMYRLEGYDDREAVRRILKYNLTGLDIDERACQLAGFGIMMKACQYDRGILDEEQEPRIASIIDSSFMDDELIEFAAGGNEKYHEMLENIRNSFENALEYGSIIKLPKMDLSGLIEKIAKLDRDYYDDLFSLMLHSRVLTQLLPLLRQAKLLMDEYTIVVTNPPYMGLSNMDKLLSEYVKKNYKDSKKDMYAVFMERCLSMLSDKGYLALITQHTWMFLSSYYNLRKKIYDGCHILHMIHLGTRAFEEINGEVVSTTAWVMRRKSEKELSLEQDDASIFFNLTGFSGNGEKEKNLLLAIKGDNSFCVHETKISDLKIIPGMPLAYWVKEKLLNVYELLPLETYADITNGLFTCDNKKFLRQWFEVDYTNIDFSCRSKDDCIHSLKKWFPYNKGGGHRKWYGNQDYVINFEGFGKEIAVFREKRGQSRSFPGADYYFRESISWSLVCPSKFSVRYYPPGFVFDIAGSSVFVRQEEHLMPMLGVLASDMIYSLIKISNPTINYQCGDVRGLPFEPELLKNEELASLAKENVEIEREDWDSFEISWGFKRHPLANGVGLSKAFEIWEETCKSRFEKVYNNENKIASIVFNAYNQDCFDYEFNKSEVNIYQADRCEDAKSFLVYAVGCILGRYSIDRPGLIYAGGKWMDGNYKSYHPVQGSFLAVHDNASANDIIGELIEFLKCLSGEDKVRENIIFLAESIGNEQVNFENALTLLRKFFRNDFIKYISKMYKKCPIYWQLTGSNRSQLMYIVYYHSLNINVADNILEDIGCVVDCLLPNESLDNRGRKKAEEIKKDASYIKNQLQEIFYRETGIDYSIGIKENMKKYGIKG